MELIIKKIKRTKGVNSEMLSFTDFEKMFKQENIDNTIRTSSVRDYAKGSVIIKDSKIKLDTYNYRKREKIF